MLFQEVYPFFDEFDCIARERNSGNNAGAQTANNIVNQILSIMDGVDKKNNILIFGKAETIVNERVIGSISYSNRVDNWERYILLRTEIRAFLMSTDQLNSEIEIAIKQTIFDSIRFVFKIDMKKAIYLHNKFVKRKFKPVISGATSKNYLFLYNLIGFNMTEKIKSIISN